jgi:hypothetical protein
MAQLNLRPHATDFQVPEGEGTCCGLVANASTPACPLPISPSSLPPQHQTVPSTLRPHECEPLAQIESHLPSPSTFCGLVITTSGSVVSPLPRRPFLLLPQQSATPLVRTPHEWKCPAERSRQRPGSGVGTVWPPEPPAFFWLPRRASPL